MPLRRGLAFAVLVLAVTPSAEAATLLSPVGDAHVTATPELRWTLAAGESVVQPQLSSDDDLFDATDGFVAPVAVGTGLAATATSWKPPRGLFAGRYLWAVSTTSGGTSQFAPPASFVMGPTLDPRASIGISRRNHGQHSFLMSLRYRTNAASVRFTVTVKLGRRVLFRHSQSTIAPVLPPAANTFPLRWVNDKVRRGRSVRISVSVRTGSLVAHGARTVAAP